MVPPVATGFRTTADLTEALPSHSVLNGINGVKEGITPANGTREQQQDVLEDYDGNYKFAPIEEAEVSRAMIKRYV